MVVGAAWSAIIIENRPGAGGNIATEAVVRAPADGYTLLLVNSANAINATLYEKLNFNFIRDVAPVAGIMRAPLVMEVSPSVPAKTVPEFISYAKANPGKVNMGSAGVGTPVHVAGEMFKMMAGINMLHVPYRGSAPHAHGFAWRASARRLRYLAGLDRAHQVRQAARVGGDDETRSEALPEVPTANTFVPGYEASYVNGVGAPKNTPNEIIDLINREINAGLADPRMKAPLSELGVTRASGFARGLPAAYCRRYREMGQGRQVRGHQGRTDCEL